MVDMNPPGSWWLDAANWLDENGFGQAAAGVTRSAMAAAVRPTSVRSVGRSLQSQPSNDVEALLPAAQRALRVAALSDAELWHEFKEREGQVGDLEDAALRREIGRRGIRV